MNFVTHITKSFSSRMLAWLGFSAAALWALESSIHLRRIYQDAWILEGIWVPVFIMIFCFILLFFLEDNLSILTILTSVLAFFLNFLPAIKYAYIYGSAIDQAAHYDLIRTIAQSGQVYPGSSYADTPGFQALVASLSIYSAGSLVIWSKLLPAILGALVPICFYVLCKHSPVPDSLAKVIIILSAISLPLLYRLNGTSFTVPLIVFLVTLFFLQLTTPQSGGRIFYTLLILLMLLVVIFWHPASTLVLSFSFVISGIIFSLWPAKKGTFLAQAGSATSLGLICIIAAFTYWMYSADFVWMKFVDNIRLVLQADLAPDPIPLRVYKIPLFDRILVFSFYHARDAILIALSSLGVLLIFISPSSGKMERFLRTYSVLWLVFMGLLVFILVSNFGAQGYRRFLHYLVAIGAPLAGYGFWRVSSLLSKYFPHPSTIPSAVVGIVGIFLIALIQLYPYQPAIPAFINNDPNEADSPLVYIHQVNSVHQYLMLEFGLNRLPTNTQLITDYFGSRQAMLFFSHKAKDSVHRTTNQRLEPAYLLLHLPGEAGAYAEQAEYRSSTAIQSWIESPNLSKVYDNSGSFILFSPDNAEFPFRLESDQ